MGQKLFQTFNLALLGLKLVLVRQIFLLLSNTNCNLVKKNSFRPNGAGLESLK